MLGYKLFGLNVLNLEESDLKRIHIFSVGSDGGDGPTDAAGAYLNYEIFIKNKNIISYIEDFDSYGYFQKSESLIKTGSTGINLMDIRGIYFD